MCEKNKQLISWNEETKAIAVICSFTEDRAEDVLKQYVKGRITGLFDVSEEKAEDMLLQENEDVVIGADGMKAEIIFPGGEYSEHIQVVDFPSEGGTIGNCMWTYRNDTLTIAPVEGTDGMLGDAKEQFKGTWPWYEFAKDIQEVIVKDGVTACHNITGMFADIANCKKFDIAMLNTCRATDMSRMFQGCKSLKDISSIAQWSVDGVENMSEMFCNCTSLADISPLAKWDTRCVTDMSGMFCGCETLADISPLRRWDISNVKYMSSVFDGCRSLADIISFLGDVAPIHTQDTTNDSVQLERWLVLAREDGDDFIYRFSEFAGMGKDAFRHLYNMKRADVETGSRNPIYDEHHEYNADAEKCEISTYVEYKDGYTDYCATAIAPGSRWAVIMYVGGINYYNSVFLPESNNEEVIDSMRKMWVDAYKPAFGDADIPEAEIRSHGKYLSIESFMPHIGTADVIAFPLTNIENGETMIVRWERTTENEQKNTSIRKEKSEDRYILIAVEKPDCEIDHSFHDGKKNAYDAVVEDMLSCTEYESLEAIIDAADARLCGFDSDGEFWATTKDGHEKYWKIIRI